MPNFIYIYSRTKYINLFIYIFFGKKLFHLSINNKFTIFFNKVVAFFWSISSFFPCWLFYSLRSSVCQIFLVIFMFTIFSFLCLYLFLYLLDRCKWLWIVRLDRRLKGDSMRKTLFIHSSVLTKRLGNFHLVL